MTPLEIYQRDLERPDFMADAAQRAAVEHLERLYSELLTQQRSGGLLSGLRRLWGGDNPTQPARGLYFWGGVGRGKTYLMDTFFDALPFEDKLRVHFHRFMRRVHGDLRRLAGEKNPLHSVAEGIASETRIICFDELFVADIADAMILGRLFEQLFARGVTLVATSNIPPDELYRDGLQRSRFLPAIELLKRHTEVVNVDGGVDYRLRSLERAELYHHPLGPDAEASLSASFNALMPDSRHIEEDVVLEVEGRPIRARKVADDVAWFDFGALCDGPRSQNDYIELARIFHAVLVADVPVLGPGADDRARRFINLVDEFYDRNVKLVVSAAAAPEGLYPEGRLAFEFQRTVSRLLEMQSHAYLGRAHKA